MGKWIFLALLVSAFSASALAHQTGQRQLCKGFLPENDLYIPEYSASLAGRAPGITKTQFNSILDKVQAEYSQEIARLGAKFKIERKWSDGTVNAYAYQDGRTWIIAMYGGMARHSAMTADGFLSVACHEVGHHLGGSPKSKMEDGQWASIEGQSDYYATLKCLRRMFLRDDNAKALASMKLDPTAVSYCRAQGFSQQDELICIRGAMAGVNLASVLAIMDQNKVPKLTTPDPRRVWTTYEEHPRAQCRMDTYFQGALCRVPYNQSLDNRDYRTGTCDDPSAYAHGLRPRCWFAP